MNKIINFGIIGSGWIVESFLAATKKVKGLNLTCVYSRTMERADEFAKKLEAQHGFSNLCLFDDLEQMAKSDKLDAVYIASPNVFHHPQSKLFLENKKHVICEKPVATNGLLVKELLDIASENSVIFMEAIMSLHSPQMRLLSEAVREIGSISQARISYCQLSSKYDALQGGELPNIFNPQMQTGCIMDIGIYCVYVALGLFSTPASIGADAVLLENRVDLCGSSVFKYSDKVVALSYSKVGDSYAPSEIIGDRGTITIDKISTLDGISVIRKENVEVKRKLLHKNADDILPMQFEAQSFYDYITDFEKHSVKYLYLSELSIKVADALHEMRAQSKVGF